MLNSAQVDLFYRDNSPVAYRTYRGRFETLENPVDGQNPRYRTLATFQRSQVWTPCDKP